MLIELIVVGLFVGAVAGFFGVGGGMILVPILMLIGFNIKAAIGMSVVQMLFSSIYGSYINYKKGKLEVNEGLWVGIGGIIGGAIGAYFTDILPKEMLQYIFLALVLFALIRVATAKTPAEGVEEKSFNKFTLFLIGLIIGTIAMMLGVGGSIMLTPILIGFLHMPSKKAATAGLFFVVFSSISGTLYKYFAGTFDNLNLDLHLVIALALAASFGVIIGLKIKEKIKDTHHKYSMVVLYLVILVMLVYKIWF